MTLTLENWKTHFIEKYFHEDEYLTGRLWLKDWVSETALIHFVETIAALQRQAAIAEQKAEITQQLRNLWYWQDKDGEEVTSKNQVYSVIDIHSPSPESKETKCSHCNGFGKELCDNPDHGLVDAINGEINRLGCPGCGHDEHHRMRSDCTYCCGTGTESNTEGENAMRIGKMMKIYCDMNEFSTRDVAKQVGISHATISRIMNGKDTDIPTAIKLLHWLFTEDHSPTPGKENADETI